MDVTRCATLLSVIVLALALSACTRTRNDIETAVGFVQQANELSTRPDETGAFPSPFRDDDQVPSDTLLTAEERRAAYLRLQAAGAATRQQAAARETRLRNLSPY